MSTIRRRFDDQAFPNAFQGAHGEWRIPVEDLLGAGFLLNQPDGEHDRSMATEQGESRDREQELERRAVEAEQRAAVAEARLQERERTLAVYTQANEDLRTSLRMLNPGPPEPPVFRYEPVETLVNHRRQRGWWQRLRGQ